MTTSAPSLLREFSAEWEEIYKSAVLSGIVGDARHQANGGYHISIEDNPSGNYSTTRPDDKAPPGTWSRSKASAVDMSMNDADMKLCTQRLLAVWNDKTDPRRKYLNAFNGWLGYGDAARWDYYANKKSFATADHKWHIHLEFRRKWIESKAAMTAVLSILKGEPKPQTGPYLRRPWPKYMPSGHYFGLITGPKESHGGYYAAERPDIKAIQQRLIVGGYVPNVTSPNSTWADGKFGAATKIAVAKWQKAKYASTTTRYGEVWSDDWKHLFTY
jgi:hypothetical protein